MNIPAGSPLEVSLMFDRTAGAGTVARLALADRRVQLEWAPDVIRTGLRISPIQYPSEAGLQGARGDAFEGLHGFLADSLPEGWGYHLMRRRLRELGIRIEELDVLSRLALVGDEGRGALVYSPSCAPDADVQALDLDALAAASRAVLEGSEAELADTLAKLAGPSGGARPKVHVGFDGQGRISVSPSETAEGHDAWIVKFAALNDPLDMGSMEAAYAVMAKTAGVTMSEHRLLPAKTGPGYFAARRFDRPARGRRLHMVSLAGAIEAPPSLPQSYDTFLRATQAITRHAVDVQQAFRRMVFNVLACNRDDHTRQHAYLMDAAGDWRLAPAYDLTWSPGPGGEHYLDVAGEGRRPTREHVQRLGALHGLPPAAINRTIDEVAAATAQWDEVADSLGVTARSRAEVAVDLRRVRADFG